MNEKNEPWMREIVIEEGYGYHPRKWKTVSIPMSILFEGIIVVAGCLSVVACTLAFVGLTKVSAWEEQMTLACNITTEAI